MSSALPTALAVDGVRSTSPRTDHAQDRLSANTRIRPTAAVRSWHDGGYTRELEAEFERALSLLERGLRT